MNSTVMETLNENAIDQHLLYSYKVSDKAPTVVIFGGIHGNEPAGIKGLQKVIKKIEEQQLELTGNFYALAGNLNALRKSIRFEEMDLNRIWTSEHISALIQNHEKLSNEDEEQYRLYAIIKKIVTDNHGPFYFIDLHTTSADTVPFITISDSLNNRKFSSNFSLPIVLGIEEYLDGPLLTYINEFGHISLGFEAGEHNDVQSILNCEAFIWLVLEKSDCIPKHYSNKIKPYEKILSRDHNKKVFYAIKHRYLLYEGEDFMMLPGFRNFDLTKKNQVLALSSLIEIKTPIGGQIFMPLYQAQGNDGFFIIHKISFFWLKLSAIVRKLKMHHVLRALPGIQQDKKNRYTLIVNLKTAQFLAVQIFHLFGYRKVVTVNNKLYFTKRDRAITKFNF